MTGEEMERAIEFILQHQATLEERIEQTQAQIAETNRIVQMQATADSDYFLECCGTTFNAAQIERIRKSMLSAYRWQYIVSGVKDERFQAILGSMVTDAQMKRIGAALQPLLS